MIDPFESTSRLLSDIASGYRQQGNQRREREENKRRYDAEQLRAATNRQEDLAYRTRRDSIQDARQAKQDKRNALIFQQRQDKIKDQEDNLNIFGNTKVNVSLDSLGPRVQEKIDNQKSIIDKREEDVSKNISELYLRRSYLDDDNNLSEVGKEVFDNRVAEYEKVLSPLEARIRAMDDVRTSRDEALASDYDVQAKKRLAETRQAFKTAGEAAIQNLTVDEFVKQGRVDLKNAGHTKPYSTEVLDALTKQAKNLGLKTRGEYSAMTAAAQEAAYQKEKDRISFNRDYYSAANIKSRTSSNGTYKGATNKDWNAYISDLDLFGTGERDQAVDLYKAVKKANPGLSEGIIREAIMATDTAWFFDKETLGPDVKGIKAVSEVARALSSGTIKPSSLKVKEEDFRINRDNLSVPDALTNRFNVRSNNTPNPVLGARLPAIDFSALRAQTAAAANSDTAPSVPVTTTRAPAVLPVPDANPTRSTRDIVASTASPATLLRGPQVRNKTGAIDRYFTNRELENVEKYIKQARETLALAANPANAGIYTNRLSKSTPESTIADVNKRLPELIAQRDRLRAALGQ
jgi:hypothetical protein